MTQINKNNNTKDLKKASNQKIPMVCDLKKIQFKYTNNFNTIIFIFQLNFFVELSQYQEKFEGEKKKMHIKKQTHFFFIIDIKHQIEKNQILTPKKLQGKLPITSNHSSSIKNDIKGE